MRDKPGKANILLVDDREENLMVLEEILAGLGQNLIRVTSGERALKHIFNQEITVVLLDVSMPGMNGFETAALIRAREKSRHIPIIFITGFSVQESQVFQGYSLGGVDYILKPIVPEILRAKVNVFVELYKKSEEIDRQRQILQKRNRELKHEIVERKRVEQELLELNKTLELRVAERTAAAQQHAEELARSNAELEQFAHIVSHDLQEPIRKIVNFSQLFQEAIPGKLNADSARYLSIVVDGALRMKNLIQDLLKFSQVGREELIMDRVDTDDLMKGILFEIEPVVVENSAQILISPLPAINTNPTLLRQLFQNLILNAIKFRGKDPPLVQISAKQENGFFLFSVRDNGIGIEPQHWEKIFKLFHRLHTREKYPGSGIGLSMCKKIVERQGGKIWVRSEAGKGATFFFTLPSNRNREVKNEQVQETHVSSYC